MCDPESIARNDPVVAVDPPSGAYGGSRPVITRRWVLVPLRLVVGFGFAAHGYAKLARGPETFAVILGAMGIPAPGPVAWMTSLLEFLGGASLMLGAFVTPLSLPLAVVMATAMFGVHLRYGFS